MLFGLVCLYIETHMPTSKPDPEITVVWEPSSKPDPQAIHKAFFILFGRTNNPQEAANSSQTCGGPSDLDKSH
jgi:hypothetical protein